MTSSTPLRVGIAGLLVLAISSPLFSAPLDDIGVTELRAEHPELTGAGVTVGLAEAQTGSGAYQVDPATTGHPEADFDYFDASGTYATGGRDYSSALSAGHADSVANAYFDTATGAAPGVTKIENFEASYFFNDVVAATTTTGAGTSWTPVAIDSRVVNQSFIFGGSASSQATVNRFYDAYAREFGTLFVNGTNNGAGNSTPAPASSFNGIAVGRTDGNHATPVQLVAPGGATSFTTPYVSGIAALLLQAADLGQANETTGDPTDSRVVKSTLLTGATKTEDWTQEETDPLDDTFGAGLVNAKNSHDILSGGQQAATLSDTSSPGGIDPSRTFAGETTIGSLHGWDLRSLTVTSSLDATHHYYFDLAVSESPRFTFSATITWHSIANLSAGTNLISDFDLALVNVDSQSVVFSSRSAGENVEHLYTNSLPTARYDLQVIMRGGSDLVATTDTYGLSYSFTAVPEGELFAVLPLLIAVLVWQRRKRSSAS
ncbi:MAG: hypothetical protein WA771_04985 [Chthoniobacterales bacterium]